MTEGALGKVAGQDFAACIEIERIPGRTQRLPPILDARDGARNEILLPALHLLVQVGMAIRGTDSGLIAQIRRKRRGIVRKERGEFQIVCRAIEINRCARYFVEGKTQRVHHSTSPASRRFVSMRACTASADSLTSSAMSSNDWSRPS